MKASRLLASIEELLLEKKVEMNDGYDHRYSPGVSGTVALITDRGEEHLLKHNARLEDLVILLRTFEPDTDLKIRSVDEPQFSFYFEKSEQRAKRLIQNRLWSDLKRWRKKDPNRILVEAGLEGVFVRPDEYSAVLAEDVVRGSLVLSTICFPPLREARDPGRARFEGKETHQRLCWLVADLFDREEWGWADRGEHAGGVGDLHTTLKKPTLYVECGNLSYGAGKILSATRASQSLLYLPFPKDERVFGFCFELPGKPTSGDEGT